jgi:linoleoyl-CoA desaturase
MAAPKFNAPSISVYSELKKKVNDYFRSNNIAPTGNYKLYFKATLLIVGYILLYIHLVFFTPTAWLAIPECILLGLLTAGIGFNVMHDGAHGSFSKNPRINLVAALSLDLLGASSFMWNTKHTQTLKELMMILKQVNCYEWRHNKRNMGSTNTSIFTFGDFTPFYI